MHLSQHSNPFQELKAKPTNVDETIKTCIERLNLKLNQPDSFPFGSHDVTCGTEIELQVAVIGKRSKVDLPYTIEHSNYFNNIKALSSRGDIKPQRVRDLERYLDDTENRVWDNSWVFFPKRVLQPYTLKVLESDLKADKSLPSAPFRNDLHQFLIQRHGEAYIRIPISYLLKLSLADCLSTLPDGPWKKTGERLLNHFLNDNSSPESHSFHIVRLKPEQGGAKSIAQETARRYLLIQLIIERANHVFELEKLGQKAVIFFSPHPPIRQAHLNSCISDNFYRELFMSPCLSGWDKGEDKKAYMELCHQVLSRSQINATAKLREAGIHHTNLVVMPKTSNISLSNNGVHASFGSLKLGQALSERTIGIEHEKAAGDIVLKISEHFLPLFAGRYSAAPFRIDFNNFRPEVVLGFLPHQLNPTHLRMIWRRWKKKARNHIFGQGIQPSGIEWVDYTLKMFLRLKGEYVPDYRLINYPIALMSTESSNALNGELRNDTKLKKDLDDLGIFDRRMSLYLPLKLREINQIGFSGIEARHFSLFPEFERDMAAAFNLQHLIFLYAWKCIVRGDLRHSHLPDHPRAESERRQPFFCAAIGIPTFFIHQNSKNLFLQKIIQKVQGVRSSNRYPGYYRIPVQQYLLALVNLLKQDAADLIEILNLKDLLLDCQERIENPKQASAHGRLTHKILDLTRGKSPFDLNSHTFNETAENYYRSTLKQKHLQEAQAWFIEDLQQLCREHPDLLNSIQEYCLDQNSIESFIKILEQNQLWDSAHSSRFNQAIKLLIVLENLEEVSNP